MEPNLANVSHACELLSTSQCLVVLALLMSALVGVVKSASFSIR